MTRSSTNSASEQLSILHYDPLRKRTRWKHQTEALTELRAWYYPRRNARSFLLHIATGGGKTLAANELVAEVVLDRNARVLWVAKSWQQLKQAASDLCGRHEGFADRVGRLGGDQTALAELPKNADAQVLYCSLQTARNRLDTLPMFDLIVWDECHWAQDTKLTGRELRGFQKRTNTRLLGLTGTATTLTDELYGKAFHRSFAELVASGHLAKPILRSIGTGVLWEPTLFGSRNTENGRDFSNLGELARKHGRTRQIVEEYVSKREKYGSTFVFACGIPHAEALRREFARHDITAVATHHRMSWAERNRALEQFEEREVDVLIGVDAIAEGVDVPHARAVFIARPTTSEVRYRQMVGRGARRTKTKKEFYVVDFVDNLTKHQDLLMTGRTIFGKRRPSEHMERPVRDRVKHIRHEFEDTTGCAYTPGPDVVPESIAELWHIKGQTFGVEFEVTRSDFVEGEVPDDWHEVAEVIHDALVEAFGSEEVGGVRLSYEHPTGKFDKWWVLWDSTVGWEVPSPILSGREGFEILEAACQALQKAAEECGLVLNHRTGTHVHLGWESFGDLDVIARGIKMVRAWEPAVATLVSPSRLREFLGWDEYAGHLAYDEDAPNEYCAPISHAFPEDILYPLDRRALRRALNDPDRRYTSVNFTRTDGGEGSTVEVRLHNGTLDPDKIAVWISLWQQILFAASQQVLKIPRTADVDLIEPSGDIIEFARLLPAARQGRHSFVERLARRRDAAGGRWEASMGVPPWQ